MRDAPAGKRIVAMDKASIDDAAALAATPPITGTSGNDTLTGTAGNDILQGLAGDDTLIGSDGIDTALYAGARAGYQVRSVSLGNWVVTDTDPSNGSDGRDTLVGVEKLRFADGDLQLVDVGEVQVNTWVRDHQGDPAIATLAGGGWIVAWTSYAQDGDGMGVYAQRFGADGRPLGSEFRVNAVVAGDQQDVALASLPGGGFVAVWRSGAPGVSSQVLARRYADDATPLGDEFAVDPGFAGYQLAAAVAARGDGGFTVVWETTASGQSHVAARSFSANGAALGPRFQVDANARPETWPDAPPSVAPLPGSGVAVVWQSDPFDGNGAQTVIRLFGANGAALGPEATLGGRAFGAQWSPQVAALASGQLVAVWNAIGEPGTGAGRGIFAQRLDASGAPLGPAFRVSEPSVDPTFDPYGAPVVAALAGGGFVVSWLGSGTDTVDVLARRFAADGSALGAPFLVNTVTYGQQWYPAARGLADGGFVIVWQTDGVDSPIWGDYGTGGVFAQRYDAAGQPMTAFAPTASVGTAIGDWLVGTAADDTLLGLAGDDTLMGAGGDDRLDGGYGIDEAVHAGAMAGFVFSNTQDYAFGVTDTDPGDGDAGHDTLIGIERVRFTDGAVTVSQRSEFVLATGGTIASAFGANDVALARLSDGRLVAAWTSSDVSSGGVFAQLLAPDATPLAAVFRVNATTWLAQTTPSVAALPDGGFLVAWDSEQDGSESGIYAQRYAANGSAVGGEFRVNTYTHSDQLWPSIAVQPSGAFLVVWNSLDQDGSGYGVYGQRFAANGTPAGTEFRINETTEHNQVVASVVSLDDGGYVVVWMSTITDWPFDADIHARRYSADGTALGGEFRVNTYTTLDQGLPTIATLAGGGFVVVWHSQEQDGEGYGVYGQRFATNGTRVGGEFPINTTTAEPQSFPVVAGLADGGFVVAWQSGYMWSPNDESQQDLYGRRFAGDGGPLGGEFRINAFDERDQTGAVIQPLADGGYLIAWNSFDPETDTDLIQARRYAADGSEVNELTVTGSPGADTLRGGEGTQILAGGAGDDVYEADLAHDRIVELPGDGRDTLWSRASIAQLPDGVEDLLLLGGDDVDGAGNALDNRITGNGGDNRLLGLAGSDSLTGGAGDDTLVGGPGDDALTGGAGHDVFEFAAIGNGVDLITDFGEGDRIRVAGTTLLGPAEPGNGATLGAGRVQVSADAGFTTLHVGTDATPGADVAIRVAGSFAAAAFYVEGETLRVNSAPVLAQPLADAQATQDVAWLLQLPDGAFVDADLPMGDRLTFAATLDGGLPLPPWLSFDPATSTFSGTPRNDDVGAWPVVVTATDGANASVSDVFVLTILDVNDPPELVAPLPTASLAAGFGLQYTLTSREIRDVDRGDILAYAFETAAGGPLPSWLSFDPTSRTLVGVPGLADAGALSIRVTATDRAAEQVDALFAVSIEPWARAAPDGDAKLAYALVHALEGEGPSPQQAGRWIAGFEAGNSAEQVATQLLADESPPIDDATLIARLYANVLERAPTDGERADLLAWLDSGAITAGGLLALAASLPENLALIAPSIAGGIEWSPWSGSVLSFDAQGPAGLAFALQHALDGETPSPAALGRWIAAFARDGEEEVARQMLEAQAPGIGNAALVARLFENVVGRPPLPDEQAQFQSLLDGGAMTHAQLLMLAAHTPQNQALIAPAIAQGMAFERWQGTVLTQDTGGAPGVAYALLFALFDAPPAPAVLGRWITVADGLAGDGGAGTPPDPAAKLALADAMLEAYEPVISNADLVRLLYTNLVGQPPVPAEQAFFQGQLDDGSLTQGGLTLLAAELDLNRVQYAELIGQGIEYLPWPWA